MQTDESGQAASAPIVKDDPARGEVQQIPQELQGKFPDGSHVVKHESGQLVANLPAPDGKWYRVVVDANQSIDKLAREVEAFQQRQAPATDEKL